MRVSDFFTYLSFPKAKSRFIRRMQKAILVEAVLVIVLAGLSYGSAHESGQAVLTGTTASGKDYIKWVDFTVSYEALCKAYDWDVDTHDTEHPINWIELLAYTAARTGGEFNKKALSILEDTAEKLCDGEATMEELTKDMKYYSYYKEAYTAVLGGMVGEYEAEVEDENGNREYCTKYGLKAYFPLARGFDYKVIN